MSILDKLKKIENLIKITSSHGEKQAAIFAKERIISSLADSSPILEYKVTTDSIWKKRLFVTLCYKYNLKPFRYYRQKYTTTNVKVSKTVMEKNSGLNM